MAPKLKNIRVNEVSLVDRPANKGAKVVLMKRDDEGNKMKNYPWMDPREDAVDKPDDSAIALAHAKKIGDQWRRLRHHLMKSESGDGMSKVEIGQKMMDALDVAALEIRKREPNLTPEQAFSKAYSDPANRSIVKAERWANGFRDLPVEQEEPIEISKAEAMSQLNAKAAELRESHPELSEAQAFSKVFTANPALARAERIASRRLLGV